MTIEIDSLSHPLIQPYAQLTETQLRNRLEPAKGIFIAESGKVIQTALRQGLTPISILAGRKHLTQARDLLDSNRHHNIPLLTADDQLLSQLTGYRLTRGILCAMQRPAPLSVSQLCAQAHHIAVADSVVNATNIGAIFRAAAALGIDALLLAHTCCDPLNRRSVRVSMGTVFQVPWAVADSDIEVLLQSLNRQGFTTIALALSDNAVNIDDPRLKYHEKSAVILGAEGDGLTTSALRICSHIARIPMQNGVDSLNVAAAAAVAFWELRGKANQHNGNKG